VELFFLEDDILLINEVAPRSHNSGQFTFGACVTLSIRAPSSWCFRVSVGRHHLLAPRRDDEPSWRFVGEQSSQWDRLLSHDDFICMAKTKPKRDASGPFSLISRRTQTVLKRGRGSSTLRQNKPVRSGRTPEHPIAKKAHMPPEDQRENETVELFGLEEHVTLSSSLFSADYFMQDMHGFSQPCREIPS